MIDDNHFHCYMFYFSCLDNSIIIVILYYHHSVTNIPILFFISLITFHLDHFICTFIDIIVSSYSMQSSQRKPRNTIRKIQQSFALWSTCPLVRCLVGAAWSESIPGPVLVSSESQGSVFLPCVTPPQTSSINSNLSELTHT